MEEIDLGGNQAGAMDALDFEIQVIANDTSEEELDQMTRSLLTDLRDLDIESASLVHVGTAPEGSKGDPIAIGTLAVTVLPTVLPGMIEMIKDWAGRREKRTVKFKGKGIEFEGSPEELEKLLRTLNKRTTKK